MRLALCPLTAGVGHHCATAGGSFCHVSTEFMVGSQMDITLHAVH